MKVIFIDRDNCLTVDEHGYTHKPEDCKLMPGAVEGLTLLRDEGYKFIVVTNQSGVGRGKFTPEDLTEFCKTLDFLLADHGLELMGTFACLHTPEDDCDCRKPKTGLFEMAENFFPDIDMDNSWMVGDRESDVEAGRGYGLQTAQVGTTLLPTLKHVASAIKLSDLVRRVSYE
jgi:D-glycero-D-manno-heptose 1,7-bisphosphate phosphatase